MLSHAVIQINAFRKKIYLLPLSLIKNFFIYSGSGLLLKGSSFLCLPVILHALPPSDYGQLSLLMSGAAIACTIAGLGLRQMLALEYFHCTAQERAYLVQNMIGIYCILGIPLLCMFALCAVAYKGLSGAVIGVTFVYCSISFFAELIYQLLQYQGKAVLLAALQCCVAAIMLTTQYMLVYYYRAGIAGIILGSTVAMVIPCTLCIYLYSLKFQHWNLSIITPYLKRSLPFVPSNLCAWVIAVGDRWLLARYATLHDVGIYAVADMVTTLFQITILAPLGAAYVPYLLNKFANDKENIQQIEQWNRRLMWASIFTLSGVACIGYYLARPLVLAILPTHYHQAVHYVLAITLGNIFLMGTYFASCLIQFHKKTYFLAGAFCVPAVINIAFNVILIPQFGIAGCVWATLLSYVGYFGLIVWYNHVVLKSMAASTPANSLLILANPE